MEDLRLRVAGVGNSAIMLAAFELAVRRKEVIVSQVVFNYDRRLGPEGADDFCGSWHARTLSEAKRILPDILRASRDEHHEPLKTEVRYGFLQRSARSPALTTPLMEEMQCILTWTNLVRRYGTGGFWPRVSMRVKPAKLAKISENAIGREEE